ncbi:MAG: diacylglycerol kinase family protein [Saprospiraceae bacterium]
MEENKDSHPVIKNAFLEELMRPQRIVFIVNPKAGVNIQRRIRTSVDQHLNHRRFEYGIWHTEFAGHGTQLAQKAIAEQYDIVVAVGGDGSINEIAGALIGSEATLGILPAGSGNGLATHLGYGRNLDQAIKKINLAETRVIDSGTLNGRPFFNVAGIGFDGLVSNLMRKQEKRGLLPYFLKSLEAGLSYTSRECEIEMDGQVVREKCFVVAVANGPMYGYHFQIAPDAQLDDGLFNVVLLKDAPRWQYFAALPATLNGSLYDASFVEHFQARKVTIRCAGENHVHLDGEGMVISGDLHFEMKPRSLKILVPKSPES